MALGNLHEAPFPHWGSGFVEVRGGGLKSSPQNYLDLDIPEVDDSPCHPSRLTVSVVVCCFWLLLRLFRCILLFSKYCENVNFNILE